jgi:transcriptional regulator with XRE-family HTH domain
MADGVEQRLRDLGEFIRNQREGARLSLRGLSSRTGISNPYLSQIERGLRKPSAEILQQIARGLAISAETLYERAGILDRRDDVEPPDVIAAIERAPDLDARQKQALIDVYQSMRRAPGDAGPDGMPADGTPDPSR